MTGWIKIYRSLLYWEWADVPEMVALWVRLIIRATHDDIQWHGVTISRGQLVTTTAKLAAESGISPQQVRTCLDRLKSSRQIYTQTTNKYTIITICKYEDYQETDNTEQQTNGKQPTRKQQTNNKPTTRITRIKEEENKNNNINPPTPLQGESPKKPPTEKEKCHAVTRYDRLWEEQFKMLTGDDFQWAKRENIAVNAIVGKIVQMMQAAGRDPTEADKENSFVWFVTNIYTIGDTWVRSNFTPHVIADKFNEYYQTIKNNGKRNNTAANPTGVSADYLEKVAKQLAGDL